MPTSVATRTVKHRTDYKTPAFTISHVDLCFELDAKATIVTSVMQVLRQTANQPLRLDGVMLTLLSVEIDGKEVSADKWQQTTDSLTLNQVPDQFELRIVTQISPQDNTALEGLYLAENTFCTQCEAEGFRRITYFLDRPDVLAVYSSTIIADNSRYPYLLSNGNKVADSINDQGIRTVKWQDPFPKPSYLFALVAGDFDLVADSFITQSGRNVSLELYVDKGAAARGDFAIQALKRAMRWDEQRFNLEYDLDVYMVVAVDFFNMGAMENKGLNVFNSKYVLADAATATDKDFFNIESIIGHEYFHNWTGNRVTCRDWFQLSLKEGLTVFRDQEFSADMASDTLTRIEAIKVMRTAQFAEDASPMAHPIRPEHVVEMNNFYTVTVYDKGAEVIRMLQTILGKDAFAAGLALYLQRHDGQAVTCDDFIQAMQDAAGVDLSQFRLWYSQSGTPELTATQQYDASTKKLTLTLTQHTAATADQAIKQDLHIPVAIEFLFGQQHAKQQHLLDLTANQQQFIFNNIAQPDAIVWLAHFSAPVKLKVDYTDTQLLQIAAKASDGVARWDAMQQFWAKLIAARLQDNNVKQALPTAVIQLMQQLLTQPQADAALTAELLALPDFDTLAEQYQQIPVQQILTLLRQLKIDLAHALAEPLLQCYNRLAVTPYQYTEQDVATRSLRNRCLHYLAELADSTALIAQQISQADNMTDSLAALIASQQAQHVDFAALISSFATKWQDDAHVMDKCFSLVATDPTEQVFAGIDNMLQHKLFSWKNPNRVRALFSAFSMRNPEQFHRLDGKGYQLLADVVAKMDPLNPQISARLITPLLSWRRFDSVRQQAMQNCLTRLLELPKLSNDLYEKVSKSIG
ncbi:aminopeptidase N [Rheinheimera salexigens]|uniref:Aminopeptidase N n=1 Tax=Rheinheimera salexigens TaxID=1628148 RepID=A0A1E7Q6P6_9GAMM|nr:aminopeptidase N [Rheinheimera salexigens]OEY69780.1 aminopeptidase N [Rheinheimera salexigens]